MTTLPKLGNWPERARKVLDDGETLAVYYDAGKLAFCLADPEQARYALSRARLGDIHVRYPRDGAGTIRVVVRTWGHGPDADDYSHHTGTAGGYGYDKRTAATDDSGAQLPTREGLRWFGDHSDRRPDAIRWDDEAGWFAVGVLVQR